MEQVSTQRQFAILCPYPNCGNKSNEVSSSLKIKIVHRNVSREWAKLPGVVRWWDKKCISWISNTETQYFHGRSCTRCNHHLRWIKGYWFMHDLPHESSKSLKQKLSSYLENNYHTKNQNKLGFMELEPKTFTRPTFHEAYTIQNRLLRFPEWISWNKVR